jgi:uncharacterized protein YdeI (YjbR/CyaY-like superfamily)
MNPLVDSYLKKAKNWKLEMETLRTLLLEAKLEEALKWGKPCYAYQETNLFIIQAFKDNCALLFFKGVLLKDEKNILVKPGENSQAARMIRFKDVQEIIKIKSILKSYIKEAIDAEKNGLKVEVKKEIQLELPEELVAKFKKNGAFKNAFNELTSGRQRAYLLFFNAAKQAETRVTRIEKYTQQILCGKGINDCTCGLSKRMPNCDGSHKQLRK